MAPSDPVAKVLRAARQSKTVTLNASEARILAAGLVSAATRLKAVEQKKASWWRRHKSAS